MLRMSPTHQGAVSRRAPPGRGCLGRAQPRGSRGSRGWAPLLPPGAAARGSVSPRLSRLPPHSSGRALAPGELTPAPSLPGAEGQEAASRFRNSHPPYLLQIRARREPSGEPEAGPAGVTRRGPRRCPLRPRSPPVPSTPSPQSHASAGPRCGLSEVPCALSGVVGNQVSRPRGPSGGNG